MDHKTPKELLPTFYKEYNLGPDGGQSDSFVKVEMSQNIHFYIPNFDARRKAVLRHDVHHLVTGYPSVLKGEAEIAAWEIASGCHNYWAALVINSQGLLMGASLFPKATYKAFVKGRRTSNLYQYWLSEHQFLRLTIGELKDELRLSDYDEHQTGNIQDIGYFGAWLAFAVLIALATLLLSPIFIFYNLWMFLIIRPQASA